MKQMIELVQGLTDVPLCIDSSVPEALEMGLQMAEGRPLLNSVTGEEDRLEFVLPLVQKYNVPVVAISNDDTGISEDPDVRFAVAKKIVEHQSEQPWTMPTLGPIWLLLTTMPFSNRENDIKKDLFRQNWLFSTTTFNTLYYHHNEYNISKKYPVDQKNDN